MRSPLDRLRTSSFLQDTAILTTGTVLAQAINLLTVPVLSRIYGPVAFGQVAVFTAVVTITATLVTLRYELAIMLPPEERASNSVAALSIFLSVFLGIPLALLAWWLPDSIRSAIGLSAIGDWLPIAVATGVASALGIVGANWLNRRRKYIVLSLQRVAQVVIAAAVAIGCGLAADMDGLILAQVAGISCIALVCLWQMRTIFQAPGGLAVAAAAREHRASPAFLLPNALLDVVSLQMPVLLITAWFGSGDAGQFSMAWRILWLPIALVGAAVGQVFYQRFAQMQSDPAGARRLLLNTWKMLLLLGGAPTLLVLALGEPVFAFVLGDEWREAGAIASIIAPMLLALLVVGPTSAAMIALGLQRYLLWFGLAAFCYRPLCLWIGYRMGDLHTGLLIYTIVEILQIGCYQLVLLRALGARPATPPE